jgi:serine/threonine protein kinase
VHGGELFDHVFNKQYLCEAETIDYITQMLKGVRHLHANHVVHLDLKVNYCLDYLIKCRRLQPENVMLYRDDDSRSQRVKLIDFGLSRFIRPGEVVREMIGTPEFVAPEIVNYEPLSPATDMWAIGVIAYILYVVFAKYK